MDPVFDVMDALEDLLKREGSSVPQYRLCKAISRRPGQKIGDYGVMMRYAGPTMTDTADRAERNGWVRRARSTDDRRVVLLELADPARFNALEAMVLKAFGEIPSSVTNYLNLTAQRLSA